MRLHGKAQIPLFASWHDTLSSQCILAQEKSRRAVSRLSESTARHARLDERDSHDTCSILQGRRHSLDWGGHVRLIFFHKFFLRLMQNPDHKRLLLLRRPPCWNKHGATHVVLVVSCRDAKSGIWAKAMKLFEQLWCHKTSRYIIHRITLGRVAPPVCSGIAYRAPPQIPSCIEREPGGKGDSEPTRHNTGHTRVFAPSPLLRVSSWLHPFKGHCEQKTMRDEGVIYVAGHPLLNRRCTILPGCIRLRNDLYILCRVGR